MAYTDNFRRQHRELLAIAGEITGKLQAEPTDAKGLRMLLSSLAGKLSVHLAMEDKALYPRLMEISPEAKSVAKAFQDEMGGLGGAFAAYNGKWQLNAIVADPAGFARETQNVFAALGKRIAMEDGKLYPHADRAL